MQGLQRVHTAYFSMAVVFVALVVSSGCAVPGYNERSAMLFEDELHTEVKFGVFTPNSDHFSEGEGSGIGIKVGYEYEYGMHFGFEIQAMDDVQGAPYSGPGVLGNAEEMRLSVKEHSLPPIVAPSPSTSTGMCHSLRMEACPICVTASGSVDFTRRILSVSDSSMRSTQVAAHWSTSPIS